ncbi:MAG: hypothetical protein KC910_28240 [Candidatus Eremiobacteraeota bacterium]|nr:hypothetical protein [Candidatus Eremiobacteraeota bacterium]
MADDYRDKIEQIRARRSRESYQGPAGGQSGGAGGGQGGNIPGYDPAQGLGARPRQVQGVGLSGVEDTGGIPNLLEGIKTPWLRDRVTLSLEGQIAMIEQRTSQRVNTADLGYTNRIPIQSLRPGLFVRIEPPGTYRLVYHNRF